MARTHRTAAVAAIAFGILALLPCRADQMEARDARIARQLALADELESEGAAAEAQYVRAAAGAEALEAAQRAEGAEAPRSDILKALPPDSQAPSCVNAKATRQGPGATFASAVVRFYRSFIASAIGARCVLEPSCSQYFLDASRKHGILGIPMIADRFVREPPESHSDRLIRTKNGQWRHHDPVEDHDWWFWK